MRLYVSIANRLRARAVRNERGDLPGWVMITVMTIVLASAIMIAFRTRVESFFDSALSQMNLGGD